MNSPSVLGNDNSHYLLSAYHVLLVVGWELSQKKVLRWMVATGLERRVNG